ncbi:MAG: sigma-70 family RNA polymerase sigma factor [Ruminococcus sp.]|nr:sigma-70 family RNA polymerase sigma factor [Ruminococcus sp.]
MSKRNSYSDEFSGDTDKRILSILEYESDDESRNKLRRILLKVINNELTPRQKEIIMLYYYKGIDTVKISRKLGITPQAVSSTMARARMKIYRILQYYI